MNIFYSYCHEDEEAVNKLQDYMIDFKRKNIISSWYDRCIKPGAKWEEEITNQLEKSDVIIFLISQSFIASEFCQKEVDYSFQHGKCIIPIILKNCVWKDTFGTIQALPKDALPINKWEHEEDAWVFIHNKLEEVFLNQKRFQSGFINELEKIEFVIDSQESQYDVKLSDLFVWPTMNHIKGNGDEQTVDASYEDLLRQRYCILRGEQSSGKSSILKKIYLDAIDKNELPLFISGEEIKAKTRQFDEVANRMCKRQYASFSSFDEYKSCVGRKILLLDDYSHFVHEECLVWAKKTFECIIATCSNEEYFLYLKNAKVLSDFNIYMIETMFSQKRYELVQKWKKLNLNSKSVSNEEFQHSVDDLNNTVNQILGRQIVPSYPFYILSILQSKESFMPHDLSFTAYGHCYHTLIMSILVKKGIPVSDIDTCEHFLSFLAYYIFKNGTQRTINKFQYKEVKDEYESDYIINECLFNFLEEDKFTLLKVADNEVCFAYPYIFFYYVGKFIAENYNQEDIEKLCKNIFVKDYASILVFVIHHTNNLQLIEEIELHCMVSFDSIDYTKLTKKETKFMDDLINILPKQVAMSSEVDSNRKKVLQESEQAERQISTEDSNPIPENKEALRLLVGFRLIDVVGQILKNRSGSIKKNKVQEILLELEKLGLRILNYALNEFNSNDFFIWLVGRIETEISANKHLRGDNVSIEKIARHNIAALCLCDCFYMLGRIANIIASETLLQVQQNLLTEDAPAFDLIYLIQYLSIKGYDYKEIKKLHKKYMESKDLWADRVLGYIVQSYIQVYDIGDIQKQELCSLLGWDLKKIK